MTENSKSSRIFRRLVTVLKTDLSALSIRTRLLVAGFLSILAASMAVAVWSNAMQRASNADSKLASARIAKRDVEATAKREADVNRPSQGLTSRQSAADISSSNQSRRARNAAGDLLSIGWNPLLADLLAELGTESAILDLDASVVIGDKQDAEPSPKIKATLRLELASDQALSAMLVRLARRASVIRSEITSISDGVRGPERFVTATIAIEIRDAYFSLPKS
jgi:hypothetical protein